MTDVAELERRGVNGMGWRPSLPDPRDLIADVSGLKVMREVDPRGEMPSIYDQYREGSCTANTVKRVIDYDRIVNGEEPFDPSRQAIYFYERKIEGQPADTDTGAMGRDGFKAAQKVGLWREADWPYIGPATTDPTQDRYFYSDPAKVLGPAPLKLERPYKSVPRSQRAMMAVLSNRQMIAMGFSVFESFMGADVAKTGIMPMPDVRRERQVGGHEIVIIGYLASEPHYALCANSWSIRWGLAGCFLMPWSVILDAQMSSDFRTIYRPAKG